MEKTNENPKTILLAEDDPDDQMLIEEAYNACPEKGNRRMVMVNDGTKLIKYLRNEGEYRDTEAYPRPDLIIMDINMPGQDGLSTLSEIRGMGIEDIPVVMLTTTNDPAVARKCQELGAQQFFTKPAEIEKLIEILAQTICRYLVDEA